MYTGLGLDEEVGSRPARLEGLTLEAVPWSWALGSWETVRKQGMNRVSSGECLELVALTGLGLRSICRQGIRGWGDLLHMWTREVRTR